MRRLLTSILCFSAFAVLPPAALADGGPAPGVSVGWPGLAARGVHYVAAPSRDGTEVEVVRNGHALPLRERTIQGSYGIPIVTWDGHTDGLSADGRTLVLENVRAPSVRLQRESGFAVLDARTLVLEQRVSLRGDFTFDALSPDGRTLYLIEHVSSQNLTLYRVRAYDVRARRLLRRIIAEKGSWQTATMAGWPITRAVSRDGIWVYTLYGRNDRGAPFVHALDARDRTAVCLDVSWRGDQNDLWQIRLRVDEPRERLLLHDDISGRTVAVLRIPASADQQRAETSRKPVLFAVAGGFLIALLAIGVLRLRR